MKQFLCQFELPYVQALKLHLDDPYRLHQWIWDALPEDRDAERDFLFRSDVRARTMRILLLSDRKPSIDHIDQWQVTEISDTFLKHPAYRFQVRANPTFRRGSDKRRLAIFDEEKLRDWFARKIKNIGAEICGLELGAPQTIRFRKENKSVTLVSVDATGLLRVTDPESFQKGFYDGIGSAKGFGFGLLMLQPVNF